MGEATTIKSVFVLGFWLGLIGLYIVRGRYTVRTVIDKIDSVGKRHYMPYHSYNYRRGYKGKHKKTIESVLSWMSVALVVLGFLAMLGAFG